MTEGDGRHRDDQAPLQLRCLEVFGGNRAERRELSVPGMDVLVYAQPHAESLAGGDVHYVSTCMMGAISRFMLADVAGHGDAVDDLALKLRKLMRKHVNTPDQTKLTRQLNEAFGQQATSGKFATAVMGTFYGPTQSLILSNAGHPPPLLRSASTGRWRFLEHTTETDGAEALPDDLSNLPLGIIEPTEYRQFSTQLEVGDIAVLYTDSMIEASGSDGAQLGPEGLLELAGSIEAEEPAAISDALLAGLSAYRGGAASDDDVTLLVMRHNAGQPPAKSVGDWVGTLGRLVTGR